VVTRWFDDVGECRDTDPASRPGFAALLELVEPGDTVVCFSLDRLGEASLMLGALAALEAAHVTVNAVADPEPDGDAAILLRYVRAGVSAYERARLRSRTRAGLQAARDRGVKLGRPEARIPPVAFNLLAQGKPIAEVARECGVQRRTLSDHWARRRNATAEATQAATEGDNPGNGAGAVA